MPLTLLLGCMFSGKSTELMRRVSCLKSIGHRVLVINHSSDDRYSTVDEVVTHGGHTMKSVKTETLCDIDTTGFEVVAIDEAQFFPDLFETVLNPSPKSFPTHLTTSARKAIDRPFWMNDGGLTYNLINS